MTHLRILIFTLLCWWGGSAFAQDNIENLQRPTLGSQKETHELNTAKQYGFLPQQELLNKRDRTSKHFLQPNGEVAAVLSAGTSLHYFENGSWRDINNTIISAKGTNHAYTNAGNAFNVLYPATTLGDVTFKLNEGNIKTWMAPNMAWMDAQGNILGQINAANANGVPSNDKLTYNNIFSGIDARFSQLNDGMELDYIINNRQALNSIPNGAQYLIFTEQIELPQGWSVQAIESREAVHGYGEINILDSYGMPMLNYALPVYYDNVASFDNYNQVFGSYLYQLNGNTLTLQTLVPTGWLTSANRAFPITIDPTVNVYPNNTSLHTGSVYSDAFKGDGNIRFGRFTDGFNVRGWSRFNTASIPDGSIVSGLVVYFNITAGSALYSPANGNSLVFSQLLNDPVTRAGANLYNDIAAAGYTPVVTAAINSTGFKNHTITVAQAYTDLQNKLTTDWFALGFMPIGSFATGTYLQAAGRAAATNVNRPYIVVTYGSASTCSPGTAALATTGAIFATETANLTLTGNGSGTSIQWETSANGTSGWASVTGGSGATTTSYTTAALTAGTYYYRAAVTNTCTEYSNVITVTVYPQPFHTDDFTGTAANWTTQKAEYIPDPSIHTRWLITSTCPTYTIDGSTSLQVVAVDGATTSCGSYWEDLIVNGMTARTQITAAAGYEDMTLFFDWKCLGERDAGGYWDYGQVGYSLDGVNYTWMNSAVSGATGHGYNNAGRYVGSNAVNVAQIPLPAALDGQPFYLAFAWYNDGNTSNYPAFIVDNINIVGTPIPFTCATVTNLAAAIGSPAHGTEHHLNVTWDAVSGALGYDLDYSTSSSSGPWTNVGTVTGSSYDFNAGDNPNVPYYFRIRAKNGATTCNYASTATPRYTAADEPALPTTSGITNSTINVTLPAETPVANPAITTYSIKDQNTGLFVQANGTLGATEVFQTKAQWGTVSVNGLTSNTQYCFVSKARNNDGHEVGGSGATILAAQGFATSGTLNTSSGSGPTNVWYSPSSCGSGGLSWNASNGCTGGAVGQQTSTPFCYVRSPAINCTGLNTVVMTFDISNSYFASLTTDQVNFNMWAPTAGSPTGTYIDASKVNGVSTDILYFSTARSCQSVTVEFDLSTVTDKSAIMFYFNTYRPSSSSNQYFMWVDNVEFSEQTLTTCATTTSCTVGTWTGLAGDNDWHNPTNWTCNTIPTASIDVTIPVVPNNSYPILASIGGNPVTGLTRDLTIASGASVSISGGGNTISVARNFTNNGTTNLGNGVLRLTNAATHVVNGNLTIGTLTVEAATTINNAVNITEALNLASGALNTTGGALTLKSNSTSTAYINDFTAGYTGTLTGNVTVERYVDNTVNGFHYVGAPVGGTNIGDWSNEFSTAGPNNTFVTPQASCNPNGLEQGSAYGGLFDYRESNVTTCYQSGWRVRSSGNLAATEGYAGVIPNGTTINLTGTANTGNINSPSLTRTTGNATTTQGMHLVSNPYPSALDWYVVDNANPDIDGTAYLWLTSGGYRGTYQQVNALTPGSSFIGSSQGFFVEALGNGAVVNFTNAARVAGNNNFLRTGQAFDSRIILEVSGNGYNDRTIVAFGADFTAGYDRAFDGKKMQSKAGVMTVYTSTNSAYPRQSTNALPNDRSVKVVPVGFAAGANGTFTFNADDLGTFTPGTLIFLEDKKTGTMQNLMHNPSYTFTGATGDAEDRFLLHFIPGIEWSTVAASCNGGDGALTLDLGVSEMNGTIITWDNYEIVDQTGTAVSTGSNANGTVNLGNLLPGTYTVTLHEDGYEVVQDITITGVALVDAAAVASDNSVLEGEIVSFNNNSNGATSYTWNFGDGNTSNDASPAYSYGAAGTYTVTLTATNGTCTDVFTQTITVDKAQDPTGIDNLDNAEGIRIFGYGRTVTVRFDNWKDKQVQFDLYDLTGRKVIDTRTLNTTQGEHQIPVANVVSGYYFARVHGASGSQVQRVFLGE